MSNVIRFIEELGRDPVRRSREAYVAAIEASELSAPEHRALLDRDPEALRGLLGARGNTACMIATPD